MRDEGPSLKHEPSVLRTIDVLEILPAPMLADTLNSAVLYYMWQLPLELSLP